jgi:threonine/homoserine/homoserine lactone efflux protein
MNEIIEGAILGLTLSMLIGPIFFALLQSAIETGLKGGLSFSSGVWLSDFLIILIFYQGISTIAILINSKIFVHYVGSIGAAMLICFGISTFISKSKPNLDNKIEVTVPFLKLFSKGFLINTINPFTIIFWLGVNTLILAKPSFSSKQASIYFGSILATLAVIDILKILLAKRLGLALKPANLLIVKKIAGILLIISGIVMVYRIFFNFQ